MLQLACRGGQLRFGIKFAIIKARRCSFFREKNRESDVSLSLSLFGGALGFTENQ